MLLMISNSYLIIYSFAGKTTWEILYCSILKQERQANAK